MCLRIVRDIDIIAGTVGSQAFPKAVQKSIGQSQGLYAAAQAEYAVSAAAWEDKRILRESITKSIMLQCRMKKCSAKGITFKRKENEIKIKKETNF